MSKAQTQEEKTDDEAGIALEGDEVAGVQINPSNLMGILAQISIGEYEDIFIRIEDGEEIEMIAGSSKMASQVYADFDAGAVQEVEGDVQAVVDVNEVMKILDLDKQEDSITLKFEVFSGEIADRLKIEGTIEAARSLSGSQSVLQRIPTDVDERFDEENRLRNPATAEDGDLSTAEVSQGLIETTTNQLSKIVNAVQIQSEQEKFPLCVEEGHLKMSVGHPQGEFIEGTLSAEVDSPENFENLYGEAFESIIDALSGEVTLNAESGSPLVVIKERSNGTIRHVTTPGKA